LSKVTRLEKFCLTATNSNTEKFCLTAVLFHNNTGVYKNLNNTGVYKNIFNNVEIA